MPAHQWSTSLSGKSGSCDSERPSATSQVPSRHQRQGAALPSKVQVLSQGTVEWLEQLNTPRRTIDLLGWQVGPVLVQTSLLLKANKRLLIADTQYFDGVEADLVVDADDDVASDEDSSTRPSQSSSIRFSRSCAPGWTEGSASSQSCPSSSKSNSWTGSPVSTGPSSR